MLNVILNIKYTYFCNISSAAYCLANFFVEYVATVFKLATQHSKVNSLECGGPPSFIIVKTGSGILCSKHKSLSGPETEIG